MSYRTDQWFRLNDIATGESLSNIRRTESGYAVPGADNQDFIYPSRAVRTVDKRGRHITTLLKRGYIRSLLTGDGLPITKCQFQFNPSAINQSVTQNTSILNFLQIDPYQYSQPLPGNVTFQFELFFDRSMEVNNYDRTATAITDDPWTKLGPEQVGVLHDLSSLYKIIGVGISEYMENRAFNAAQEYIGTAIDTLVDRKTTEITSDDAAGLDADKERAEYRQAATDFLAYNRGNTAFLLPLPVRVVFSSLYIVEGLVQDFNVLFTKFNTSMVPMQCSVTVTFEAKYIGFAKKDTFFTAVLDLAREEAGNKQYNQISDSYEGYLDAIIDDLTTVRMMVTEDDEKADKEQDYSGSTAITKFVSMDVPGSGDRNIESLDKYVKLLFNDRGKLYNLMTQGTSVSIAASGKVEAWRFTNDFRSANSRIFNSAGPYQNILSAGVSANSGVPEYDRASSVGKDITNALDNWISRSGDQATRLPDEVYQNLFPAQEGVGDRVFNTVTKLWEVQIGDANRGDEAVINASTSDEWLEMKTKFCYSNNQNFGNSDRNLDDGVNTPNESSMDYDEATVFWAVRFTLQLVVNINGESATRETTAYIIRNQNGDFNVDTSLKFDWEALRDDVIATGA